MSGNNDYKKKTITVNSIVEVENIECMEEKKFAFIGVNNHYDKSKEEEIFNILQRLKKLGYKLNYNNDSRDDLGNKIFQKYYLFSDIYLPFKNFNAENLKVDDEVLTPVSLEPSIKAHKIAASLKYYKPKDDEGNIRYNTLSEFVKKFSARDIQLLLGNNCASKIEFLIVYTNDEVENVKEDKADYATTGSALFPIMAANRLGIPVYNLNKDGRLKDLSDMIAVNEKF